LKDDEVKKRYKERVKKEIVNVSIKDTNTDTDWDIIRGIVSKAAEDCAGALKKFHNS